MASAGNVYWSVGSSATIGDYGIMVGNIIATASITFNSYSTLSGRGLAGAAITCASGSTLTLALQTAAPPSMSPTFAPSATPTFAPSNPTSYPTYIPTMTPTAPTYAPTATPSLAPSSAAPTRSYAVNFRRCTNSVLQAQSAITFAGTPTTLYGDIGIAPGTAITAENVALHTGGVTHHTDAYAANCAADTALIAAQAAGQTCQSIPSELGKIKSNSFKSNRIIEENLT